MDAPHSFLAVGFGSQPAAAHPSDGGIVNEGNQVGSGRLTDTHNTPLQVGGLLILALIAVVTLQVLGFRFVVSAGIGKS